MHSRESVMRQTDRKQALGSEESDGAVNKGSDKGGSEGEEKACPYV